MTDLDGAVADPGGDQATEAVSTSGTDETSSGDAGAGEASGQTQAGDPEDVEAAQALISDEEFQALQESSKGDVEAIRKGMNRAFTQKMQRMSQEMSGAREALAFVQQFQQNPAAVLQHIANRIGYDVSKREQASEMKDQVFSQMAEVLGEDGAKTIMPAISALVDKSLEPLRQDALERAAREAETLSKAAIDGLTERYPDWQKYEPKMMELAKKLDPKGMDEAEYLDKLYILASHRQAVADEAASKIKKITKAAAASESSGSRSTSPKNVTVTSNRRLSFKEAAAMAKRGERVE